MALTKISTGGVKDDTADEAKLKVSNAGSNGQFLSKQSGNTGGLTWADGASEGTEVKSTGESGGSKYLREDGDGTSSWQAVTIPPAGNTFTAVANGSIANNKCVKIDTDGKVSEIKAQLNSALTSAGALDFSTHHGPTGNGHHAINIAANKILVARSVSNVIKVGIWTLSSGGTAVGNVTRVAEVTASSGSSNTRPVLCKIADDKFFISWYQSGGYTEGNDPIWGRVGTISGTTITWGTIVMLGALAGADMGRRAVLYDPDEARVVVLSSIDSGKLKAIPCSVSGTTITVGTASSALTDDVGFLDACYDTTNDKVICIYEDNDNSQKAYIVSVTIDGNNAPTFGTPVESADMEVKTVAIEYDPNQNKFLYGFRAFSGSSNEKLCANFGSCNSSGVISIQVGSSNHTQIYNLNTTGLEAGLLIRYDDAIDKFHMVFRTPGTGSGHTYHSYATIPSSGNSVSYATATELMDVGTEATAAGHAVPMFTRFNDNYWIASCTKNSGSSNIGGILGWLRNTGVSGSNLLTQYGYRYVGFADQAYTNGQTATIKTYGNNVTTLSGLTPGSLYYVQKDGTVATSADSFGWGNAPGAGIALTSSTLLIKDPHTTHFGA